MSFTLDAGRMRFNPGGACIMTAYKDFVVTPGKPYNVDFDLDRTGIVNFTAEIYTTATLGGTGTLITTLTATNGRLSYTLTPAAGQNFIRVSFKKNSGENTSFYIDNLQIRTVAAPYAAVVVMKSDYYPYGMQMPGRHTNDPNYRYGYNGMEKDAEMHGEGNSYTTEFRQYDPRLGRWLSLDPLKAKYPGMSPYTAFNDNPVYFVDPFGLEGVDPEKEPNPDAGSEHADRGTLDSDFPVEKGDQLVYVHPQDKSGNAGTVTFNYKKLDSFSRKAFDNGPYIPSRITGPDNRIFGYQILKPTTGLDLSGKPKSIEAGSETPADYPGNNSIKYGTPKTRAGRTDRRFKLANRSMTPSSSTGVSSGVGRLGLVLAITELVYTTADAYSVANTNEKIRNQSQYALDALYDIQFALEVDLIPEAYINPDDLAVIANVLISGDMTKSDQRYIFRVAGHQHLKKKDFSDVIRFAQGLRDAIFNYETDPVLEKVDWANFTTWMEKLNEMKKKPM